MEKPLPSERPDSEGDTVDGRTVHERAVDERAVERRGVGRRVIEVAAVDTHDLRRRVLRVGTPTTEVRFAEDDLDGTFHLAVEEVLDGSDAGSLVAISTWVPRPHRDHPAIEGIQLRGMATDPRVRGTGCGALVLQAGLDRARLLRAELVWARARDSALDFYLAHGFTRFGPGYTDLATALPHHDVIRDLESGHIEESRAGSV